MLCYSHHNCSKIWLSCTILLHIRRIPVFIILLPYIQVNVSNPMYELKPSCQLFRFGLTLPQNSSVTPTVELSFCDRCSVLLELHFLILNTVLVSHLLFQIFRLYLIYQFYWELFGVSCFGFNSLNNSFAFSIIFVFNNNDNFADFDSFWS